MSNPHGLNPNGPTLQGIDVAYPQGAAFDWRAVAADGIRFAYCKATQGAEGLDKTFGRNWIQSRANGVLRGAYHFLSPGSDPIAQADHFLRTVGPLADDDLHPMLDVEVDHGKPPAQILEYALRWTEHVEAATGRPVVLYTYPSFFIGALGNPLASPLGARPLWIAHYVVDPNTGRVYGLKSPTVPRSWQSWRIWQTSGNRGPRIPGIEVDVDRDVFWGDEDAFRAAFCGRRDTLPSPVMPPPDSDAPTWPGGRAVAATPLRAGEGEHDVPLQEIDFEGVT